MFGIRFLLNLSWKISIAQSNYCMDQKYRIDRLGLNIVTMFAFLMLLSFQSADAQQFPGEDENIPYLITFGNSGSTSWGDDDFSQTFFLSIPPSQVDPFYVRVFDPDVGGELDEMKGSFNTSTKFQIYGGKTCYTETAARGHNPEGNYKSGTLLASKTFGVNEKYDEKWYTFGPFNPTEGEYVEKFKAYIFKVIADGTSGDDGNIYKYFLSVNPSQNLQIEGANAFTYEYTFRLPNNRDICHIYPYVNENVVSVQQYNFDWDSDGVIRVVSVARKGETVKMSTDDDWAISKHMISEDEKNTSLDIQLIKSNDHNYNNVVFRITNQYGEYMPFFSLPIGGRPVYRPKIKLEKI